MGRIDTLANCFTDICDAIRAKTGKTDKITPANITTEIANIPTGGGEPNIFIQEEEPTTKEGLWIQASGLQVDNIVCDEFVYTVDTWRDKTLIPKLVSGYNTKGMSCAVVGDYLYLGGYATQNGHMYKVNLNDFTFEDLGLPTNNCCFYGKHALVYNSEIYYIGNNSGTLHSYRNSLFKYNPETNEYTPLANPGHYPTGDSQIVLCGDYIYVFGVNKNSNDTTAYAKNIIKYNILDNTWTALDFQVPWSQSYNVNSFVLGDKIWFLFVPGTNANYSYWKGTYMFDPTLDEFVTTNLSFDQTLLNGTASSPSYTAPFIQVVDDSCYVISYRGVYKIPITDIKVCSETTILNIGSYLTSISVADIDLSSSRFINTCCNDKDIFMCGFNETVDYDVLMLSINTKEYDNNTLVIRQGVSNSSAVLTQLFSTPLQSGRMTYPLYNAIHYTTEGGANNALPLYYGDGTQWIKFKN